MTEDEHYLHNLREEFKKHIEERIEKTLALNIAHIRPDNLELITNDHYKQIFPMRYQKHLNGIIFFTNLGMDDSDSELEDNWFIMYDMNELCLITRTARQFGCSIINFDNAIPETDAFETFSN